MFEVDWAAVIASGDAESIWNALYSLVRDRDPILCTSGHSEQLSLDEIDSDIAQEVFLRLISGDRLTYFLASGYTSDQIESELILNELAEVLISRMGSRILADTASDSKMSPSECEKLSFQAAPSSKPA